MLDGLKCIKHDLSDVFTVLLYKFWIILSVNNYSSEMPKYARICRIILENASRMDFTHKCRHFPNPDKKHTRLIGVKIFNNLLIDYIHVNL